MFLFLKNNAKYFSFVEKLVLLRLLNKPDVLFSAWAPEKTIEKSFYELRLSKTNSVIFVPRRFKIPFGIRHR